jgi:hypothetical protein
MVLLNEEDLLTDPFRIARGLMGYALRARSCAPSSKETRPSLTRPQPPLGAQELPWALGSRSMAPPGPAQPLALARLMMPAKARAQEDKPQATDA